LTRAAHALTIGASRPGDPRPDARLGGSRMHHGQVAPAIAKGLLALKKRIAAAKVPSSKLDESLNIATWNIREFGKHARSEPAIHYIAEIIGQFDLVGAIEVREDLSDLRRVMNILGSYWRAVYSDVITDPGGNRERIAYVFDKRAIAFNGLAAEADAPRQKKGLEYLPDQSFWRSPYLASFKSGSFDFIALTTHIRWGDSLAARTAELAMLADWIEGKRREKFNEDIDLIVMGDFNIPSLDDPSFAAITKHGLRIPDALRGLDHGSNLARDKRYDQILHYPQYPANFANSGGVLDYFIDDAHIVELFGDGMQRSAFTFQMSDHLPLWMQINTDIDGFKLDEIVQS
jgi:endonuclease/exonuclease/phosphatase family metal-dependent hydrolase